MPEAESIPSVVPPNEINLKDKRKDFPTSPLSQYKINNTSIALADPDKRILDVEEEKRKRLSSGRRRVMQVIPETGNVIEPEETVVKTNVTEKFFALNPPNEVVERTCKEKRSQGGTVIVDVGHGYGISTDMKKGDVFIGIEPYLGADGSKIRSLKAGMCSIDRDSDTFVFESTVQDVDLEIVPDLVMCIAPHPADVMDGSIFVGVKEKFLDDSNASFLLVVEGDSIEAREDKGQMLKSIKQSFGDEYEVIGLKKDTTLESIPASIMKKHFGVERRVVFNSNSFQGEAKKTIYKIKKKQAKNLAATF